jgi:DNA polymerase-3 subunit delta
VALRSAVEASAIGMALPCFGDEDRDIDSVIDEELGKSGMGIAMEARGALRRNLGGDRLATRGEMAKLALYAFGKREIGL